MELLARHAVRLLADVRTVPRSRRVPQFDAGALATRLPEHGVAYVHLAELGGWRRPRSDSPNRGWENAGFRGYADHMESAEFARGLERLERLAQARPAAVMCAEGAWWRCHRRLLADALVVRGWRAVHIGPRGEAVEHALTDFARVEGTRITYPPPPPTREPG